MHFKGGGSKVREAEQELGERTLHEHPHEVSQLPHGDSGEVFAQPSSVFKETTLLEIQLVPI